jgi:hypothetical protein
MKMDKNFLRKALPLVFFVVSIFSCSLVEAYSYNDLKRFELGMRQSKDASIADLLCIIEMLEKGKMNAEKERDEFEDALNKVVKFAEQQK